ncbi:hypothetical protein M7I_3506 [Glarea lozoyensis 74030]|uniref:Uncharacterized protein n=1 Tax=Glarea lozoyensis (strain ATCC 74030 / MF5533) TaxID=1104152 RepID=H0ELN9_GLAL7|nr:hypothetical protein M7I_3506 [Glarea lozoyensis 74030]
MAFLKRQQLNAKTDLEAKKTEMIRSQSSGASKKFPSTAEVQIKQKDNAEKLYLSLTQNVKEKEVCLQDITDLASTKLNCVIRSSGENTASHEVIETLRKDKRDLEARCQQLESAQEEMKSSMKSFQDQLEKRVWTFQERSTKIEQDVLRRDQATSARYTELEIKSREAAANLHNLGRWREITDSAINQATQRNLDSDKTLMDVKDDIKKIYDKESKLLTLVESIKRDAVALNEKVENSTSTLPDEMRSFSGRLDSTDQSVKSLETQIDGHKNKSTAVMGHVDKLREVQDRKFKEAESRQSVYEERLTTLESRASAIENAPSRSNTTEVDRQEIEPLTSLQASEIASITKRLETVEDDLAGLSAIEESLGGMMNDLKASTQDSRISSEARTAALENTLSNIRSDTDSRLKSVEDTQVRVTKTNDSSVQAQIRDLHNSFITHIHGTFPTKDEMRELDQRLTVTIRENIDTRLQQLEPRLQRLADHCEANGLAVSDLDSRYANINTVDMSHRMADQFSQDMFPQLNQLRDSLEQLTRTTELWKSKIKDIENSVKDNSSLSIKISDLETVLHDEISKLKTEVVENKRETADYYCKLKDELDIQKNPEIDPSRRSTPYPMNGTQKRKLADLRNGHSAKSSHSSTPSIVRAKKSKIEHKTSDDDLFLEIRAHPISDGED